MRGLALFLLLVFSCTALAGDAEEEDPFAKGNLLHVIGVAAGDVLNLRSEPAADADVLSSLSSRAFMIGATGEKKKVGSSVWVKVTYEGVTGWVNGKYLEGQYGELLTREELFDLGISVVFTSEMDMSEVEPGYGEGPQHPNRCMENEYYYVVSVSDAMLEHFKKRGFTLGSLCLGLTAPINMDPETGYDVPSIEVAPRMHLGVMLNLPDCLKNGTPLLDCDVRYDWFWGKQGPEDVGDGYREVGRWLDTTIRRGIADGSMKHGPIETLSKLWSADPEFGGSELGMYVGYCEVSSQYPRGYGCALSTKRVRGDGGETGAGAVNLWTDAEKVACIQKRTCTPTSIFFGTVRKLGNSALRVSFNKERDEKLTLGRALVTVPKARQRGEVNRPAWSDVLSLRSPYTEDPERHFTIPAGGVIVYPDEKAFMRAVGQFIQNKASAKEHALVFVHGFNVSFEDALYRTAQLTYDLGDNGIPFGTAFLFSWPSAAQMDGYLYDSESARHTWAVKGLVKYLSLVAEKSGVKHVHVIAHSMGNLPLLAAMDELKRSGSKAKFDQVVFAAPDVDKGEFEIFANRIQSRAKGFTLYASSRDTAMVTSRRIRLDTPRAGDVTAAGPVIVKGLDTIDASDVSLDYFSLRHSEYADNKELIGDLSVLFAKGVRPPHARNSHFSIESGASGTYWKWK